MPQPRPALKCIEGVIEGLDVTMQHMQPGVWTDYYCVSVDGTQLSTFFDTPHVPLPEPGFIVGALVGVLLLGALYERARPGRPAGRLSRVRVKGQRRRLRDRIREVLRPRL